MIMLLRLLISRVTMMAMNDCKRILLAIERKRDTFRLMQKGVVFDLITGEVYEGEGISDGGVSGTVRDVGRQA